MKVTFVRPPFYNLLNAANYKLNTYPLNIAYLSASARANGDETAFVDGETLPFKGNLQEMSLSKYVEFTLHNNVKKIDEIMRDSRHSIWIEIADKILATTPDVVAITCYSSSMNSVKIICENIKARADIPIVLGGIHPTSLPLHSLKYTAADIVVIGEGEEVFPKLLRLLSRNEYDKLMQQEAVAYRDKDGNILINENRRYISELDTVAFPDRDIFDRTLYYGDVISTSRGCPFNCNYCASKVMWQRKVRFRSVNNVIAELEILKDKYNTEFIRIVDDTFTLDKKRVLALCRQIQEKGLDSIRISLGSRVDTLSEDVVRELKKSGVETVTLGIESASPQILKFIGKDETQNDMARAVLLLKKYGIQSHAFFMIGFPGETKKDIDISKEFIAKYRPDYAEVNMVTPYPGTALWEGAMKNEEDNIDNWYQRFHHGLSSGFHLDYDLNEEYESFLRFTKDMNIRGEATTAL